MFFLGENIKDIPDIKFALRHLTKAMNKKGTNKQDFEYLNEYKKRLKSIQQKFKKDWASYCYVSKLQYDKRHNLAPTRDKDGKLQPPRHKFGYESIKQFTKGAKLLYYAGPHRPGINHKWRQKWTGPWYINQKIGKFSVKIVDNKGKGHIVDIDRLKLFKTFKQGDLIQYPKYEETIRKLNRDEPTYSDEED